MFPSLPDALSKPEFEQLMQGLAPVKAESWREFWTICEVLQALKEAEYWRCLSRSACPIGETTARLA
jgi:hypothetical protein